MPEKIVQLRLPLLSGIAFFQWLRSRGLARGKPVSVPILSLIGETGRSVVVPVWWEVSPTATLPYVENDTSVLS